MDSEKREDLDLIPSEYGFFRNLHMRDTDVERKFKFIEFFLGKTSSYYYNVRSMLKLVGGTLAPLLIFAFILSRDTQKQKYIAIPILLIMIGIVIITIQASILDRSGGSLLSHSFQFLKELYIEHREKIGKKKRFKELGLKKINSNGLLEFENDLYGYIYEVDGNISKTSYPSEIRRQASVSSEYQNTRNCTTTEIKITLSARQTVDDQRKNLRQKAKLFESKNGALFDLCNMQANFLENQIEGNMPMIQQYLIILDPSKLVLEEYANRLNSFVSGGRGIASLYKNVRRLSKTDAIDIFTQIQSLK